MKEVPDRFPEGCEFVASFSGYEFVKFPNGEVYKASDDGRYLIPRLNLPFRDAAPMDEESFLHACAVSRKWAKAHDRVN